MDFVQVVEEDGEEPIELPIEPDKNLLLSTLQSTFPGASGLKFLNEETKCFRGIRLNDGKLYPPSESGWGNHVYHCVFPKENKRKSDDQLENSTAKTKRMESRARCTDLIVLGLPWKTTEESLRAYFETFGEVLMAQIKKDVHSGQSKGFGFVRFGSYDVQARVLSNRHSIDGRWCEVKVPNSKGAPNQIPCKVFVGRCTEDITAEDLKEYFSKFGEVTDVFIPRPFRAFSFVTFLDPEVAASLCGEDHIVKGVSLHVSSAAPKYEHHRNSYHNANNGGRNSHHNSHNENPHGGLFKSKGPTMHNSSGNYYANTAPPPNEGGSAMLGGGNNTGGAPVNRENTYPRGNRGNYMMTQQPPAANTNNSSSNFNSSQNRPLDMHMQTLGINPPPGPNSTQNMGMGLNLNSLPMNTAILAAALNQFGLLGNPEQSGNFLSWMAHSSNSNNMLANNPGNRGPNSVNSGANTANQPTEATNCNNTVQNPPSQPNNGKYGMWSPK
ncbi:TAR DNA-binding protein 43 isoform X1 [Musca domestica]|uniref:TAR DNA-binding protein 43 isoform X1 n=2 Tax=Musca domestica TaxID=7370 RepID=A0A9J7CYT3_MUSDO|nr:TAR DNA-binding protein 43 isoform X1 [Musca domestica]